MARQRHSPNPVCPSAALRTDRELSDYDQLYIIASAEEETVVNASIDATEIFQLMKADIPVLNGVRVLIAANAGWQPSLRLLYSA
jgi:hypothetical protein